MKTLLVVLAYLFLFIYQSSATPQIPDELTLNFEKIDVHNFMFDDLIKQQIKLTKNKHCSAYSLTISANHRGFIAVLYVKNKGYADWFSGDLYHYYGKPLSYRHTHRLSQARVLSFSKGNLVSDKNISVKE